MRKQQKKELALTLKGLIMWSRPLTKLEQCQQALRDVVAFAEETSPQGRKLLCKKTSPMYSYSLGRKVDEALALTPERSQGGLRAICTTHPRYRAKRKPTAACNACERLYEISKRVQAGGVVGYETIWGFDDHSNIRITKEL